MADPGLRAGLFALCFMCLLPFTQNALAADKDPDILWKILHDQCLVHLYETGDPSPCVQASLVGGEARGFVVYKSRDGIAQYLLMPTAKMGGIESPELLAPHVTNYFAAAWDARRFLEARLGRSVPREMITLSINSMGGRGQNQLHIHIDCIRADVMESLRVQGPSIGPKWTRLKTPLLDFPYRAMRIDRPTLEGVDPFKLLARTLAVPQEEMANQTLVIVGAHFAKGREGFYLLADTADPATGDKASGEKLADHECAVVRGS